MDSNAKSPQQVSFQISTSGRDGGTIEAAYVSFAGSRDKAARMLEILEDILLADYDAADNLLGFELLAPVRIAELERWVPPETWRAFRAFLEQSGPREWLVA